jgi:hypothetical protein
MIDRIAPEITRCLRFMDNEANLKAMFKGQEDWTGLYWYSGFSGVHGSEKPWTKRLPIVLKEQAGIECRSEVCYPGTRKRCDLVLDLPDGSTLWLEVKGAWREWWAKKGSLAMYRSYLLAPHVPSVSRSHSAVQDVTKLKWALPPHADYVGLLIVGFDSADDPMDQDIVDLGQYTGLNDKPWASYHEHWDDPYRPGNRVRCWLWCKAAT